MKTSSILSTLLPSIVSAALLLEGALRALSVAPPCVQQSPGSTYTEFHVQWTTDGTTADFLAYANRHVSGKRKQQFFLRDNGQSSYTAYVVSDAAEVTYIGLGDDRRQSGQTWLAKPALPDRLGNNICQIAVPDTVMDPLGQDIHVFVAPDVQIQPSSI